MLSSFPAAWGMHLGSWSAWCGRWSWGFLQPCYQWPFFQHCIWQARRWSEMQGSMTLWQAAQAELTAFVPYLNYRQYARSAFCVDCALARCTVPDSCQHYSILLSIFCTDCAFVTDIGHFMRSVTTRRAKWNVTEALLLTTALLMTILSNCMIANDSHWGHSATWQWTAEWTADVIRWSC